MNKYQDALLSFTVGIAIDSDYDTLNELCERATPKKSIIDVIKFGGKPCENHYCICGYIFIFKSKFCPNCGQAIDWNDEL